MASPKRDDVICAVHCDVTKLQDERYEAQQGTNRILFQKLDRLNATAFALLIAVIADITVRIWIHNPR